MERMNGGRQSHMISYECVCVCVFLTFYNILKHIVKPCEARRVYSRALRCTFSFIIHMVFFSELKACLSHSLDSGNLFFFFLSSAWVGGKKEAEIVLRFSQEIYFCSRSGKAAPRSSFPKFIHPNPPVPRLLLFSSCFPPCHLILSHLYFSMTPFAKIVAYLSKWVKEWR